MTNEICVNCGHDIEYHGNYKKSSHREGKCNYPKCPCKKFVAQTQSQVKADKGLANSDTHADARKGCGKDFETEIGKAICGRYCYNEDCNKIHLCPSCEAKQEVKPIILDDNPISIASYAEEFPENWEKITKALAKKRGEDERGWIIDFVRNLEVQKLQKQGEE